MTTTEMTDHNQLMNLHEEAEREKFLQMCKGQVELGEALKRLQKNDDFNLLFDKAFFTNNLRQQTKRLGQVTNEQNVKTQERIVFAIGYLDDWLDAVITMSEQAKLSLEEAKEID